MSLVNLDGTSIFGAGSEWFWSMAQFMLVAVSIYGVYVQVRAQRAASVTEQTAEWEAKWMEEPFAVQRLAALVDLEVLGSDEGLPWSFADVGDFFERIGYLTAKGHLRVDDVWHYLRQPIGVWWIVAESHLERTRADLGNSSLYEWFEKLEGEMRRIDVKALGQRLEFGTPAELVSAQIDRLTSQLRTQSDARNGVYPARRERPAAPDA